MIMMGRWRASEVESGLVFPADYGRINPVTVPLPRGNLHKLREIPKSSWCVFLETQTFQTRDREEGEAGLYV